MGLRFHLGAFDMAEEGVTEANIAMRTRHQPRQVGDRKGLRRRVVAIMADHAHVGPQRGEGVVSHSGLGLGKA